MTLSSNPLSITYSSKSNRITLAISLLEANFGPIVTTLCKHLLFKGPTTFLDLVSIYGRRIQKLKATAGDEKAPTRVQDPDAALDTKESFVELTGTKDSAEPNALYGARKSKFSLKEIQVAMLLMVRHRFVRWVEQADESKVRIYFVDVDHIFRTQLFGGTFVGLGFDKWKELGADVCREFICNGSLTFDQLMNKLKSRMDEELTNEYDWKQQLGRVFDDMISNRFLQRAETVKDSTERLHRQIAEARAREEQEEQELHSKKRSKKAKTIEEQLGIEERTSKVSKRGKRRKKSEKKNNEHAAVDLRSKLVAMNKKRKRSTTTSDDLSPVKKKKKKSSGLSDGDDLGLGSLSDLNDDTATTGDALGIEGLGDNLGMATDDEVHDIIHGSADRQASRSLEWELNIDELIRSLRKKRILEHIDKTFDTLASDIVKAILELSSTSSKNSLQTSAVQFDKISGYIQRSERKHVSSRMLDRMLDSLIKLSLVERVSSQDRGTFRVNMGNIINKIKEKRLESIIHQKLGTTATRIFRMLLAKKYMEQKSVAEEAMVQSNEARKHLYLLMQHGYVQMEEVPRGSDRTNPLRTIFLWHVKPESVLEKTTEEMYRTIYNLRVRLHSSQKSMWEKVGIGHNTEALSNYTFSDDQLRMLSELNAQEDLLEVSMIRLSNMLMLFEDF